MIRKISSPLLVWVLLFIFAAAGLVGVLLYIHTTSRPFRIVSNHLNRLDSIRLDNKDFSVVIMGNSLLEYALPQSESIIANSLQEEFRRRGCDRNKVTVVNLAFGGGELTYMQSYIDKILGLHPSLLILQVEVVASPPAAKGYRRYRKDLEVFSRIIRPIILARARKLSKSLRKPLISLLPSILRPSQGRTGPKKNKTDGLVDVDASAILLKQQDPSFGLAEKLENKLDEFGSGDFTSNPSFLLGRSLIQQALHRGIRVAVVETPLCFSITSRVPGNVFEERTMAVRQLFGNSHPVYLRYTRVLPDGYFMDYRHLNDAGRALFLKWFSRAVVEENIQYNSCPI